MKIIYGGTRPKASTSENHRLTEAVTLGRHKSIFKRGMSLNIAINKGGHIKI
jgi:hypothetical protein